MPRKDTEGRAKAPSILVTLSEVGSLRRACKQHDVLWGTFLRWVNEDPELANQYARAREAGLEAMAEDLLDIADDGTNDTYTTEDGAELTNYDVIARSRLRVDSRKWLLSKCLPKKYGDAVKLLGDPDNPVQVTITRHVIAERP